MYSGRHAPRFVDTTLHNHYRNCPFCCNFTGMPKPESRRATVNDRVLYEKQAAICKAFAHPSRIQLLDLLGNGERSCSDLQKQLGISKANLSQHVSQLRNAGVIATRRDGKQLFCYLSIPEVKDACNTIRKVLRCQLRDAHRMLTRRAS